MPEQFQSKPLGYQQITSLTAATALTPPSGSVYAVIVATGQSVRWRDDAVDPTASVGVPLLVDATMVYDGPLDRIRFIEQAASAVLNVAFYA